MIRRPTDWFKGSGGAGETLNQLWLILANRACAERHSRYQTGAGRRFFLFAAVDNAYLTQYLRMP